MYLYGGEHARGEKQGRPGHRRSRERQRTQEREGLGRGGQGRDSGGGGERGALPWVKKSRLS